jgi:hypothetical protein
MALHVCIYQHYHHFYHHYQHFHVYST